jgi:phosphoenolpyruvate synthase/pyruvate phosphate dikinase
MLKHLKPLLTLFNIPEFLSFTTEEWYSNKNNILNNIRNEFFDKKLIIRSSAEDEDSSTSAKAGEYHSELNVQSNNLEEISNAVQMVIQSYEQNGPRDGNDEVLVQVMIEGTSMSGVIFTHDLNTGAPYYVINYDDESGLTNTVTSGDSEYSNRTLYIHRGAIDAVRSKRFTKLITAVKELEYILKNKFLDIEFALDSNFRPYLFQVREITTQPNWNRAISKRIDAALKGIQNFISEKMRPAYQVYGKTTVFGQMPDWNPAEMIGRAPRALAFSLYKTLITDHAWRIARETMGYAVPAGQPLMVSLAGQPFIDTRLSFHSFIPAELSNEIGNKLVDTWLKRLQENPERHDKVEFDVAITTYSFDIDEKIDAQIGATLNHSERIKFKDALLKHTQNILHNVGDGSINNALNKLDELEKRQAHFINNERCSDITSLFGIIEDCIRLGTVPFSILARHGFIAKTILLSLKNRGILMAEDINSIQSGFKTVASDLVKDMRRLQLGKLSRSDFMNKYGHLRPGTYDILSRRYDQMPDIGKSDSYVQPDQERTDFALSIRQKMEIDELLQSDGFIEFDANALLEYIKSATVGREYGKFVFTRSISEILETIASFGEKNGLSRDEISHVPIDKLLDVVTRSDEGSIEERLRMISEKEAEQHSISVAIRLPQVLFDEAGVHVVPFQVSYPNFITHKKVTAPCISLVIGQTAPNITGKIVLIENADPGFDWIFSQKIGGLITKFGGANSHMAIRCAEFGIPAAIGCGEQRYEMFLGVNQILLDCAAGLINPLH